jgi:hypothetical protein
MLDTFINFPIRAKCLVDLILLTLIILIILVEKNIYEAPHYANWLFMTPSIATKFQYINSLLFSFLTHHMFRLLRAILR